MRINHHIIKNRNRDTGFCFIDTPLALFYVITNNGVFDEYAICARTVAIGISPRGGSHCQHACTCVISTKHISVLFRPTLRNIYLGITERKVVKRKFVIYVWEYCFNVKRRRSTLAIGRADCYSF